MSESPQGHGWWQASDGRWYAPELHPRYEAPPPPPLPRPPEQASTTDPLPPVLPTRPSLPEDQTPLADGDLVPPAGAPPHVFSQPAQSLQNPTVCPVCRSNDQIQRIRMILDTGATHTTGVTRHTHTRGVTHDIRTTSELAKRFTPPQRTQWGCLLAVALMIALCSLGGVGNNLLWLLGVIPAVLLLAGAVSLKRDNDELEARLPAIRMALDEGYFCMRDGVAFHPALMVSHSPEDYVKWGGDQARLHR